MARPAHAARPARGQVARRAAAGLVLLVSACGGGSAAEVQPGVQPGDSAAGGETHAVHGSAGLHAEHPPHEGGGRDPDTIHAATTGLAEILCGEDTFDFGQVWDGAVLPHTFLLEADGDEALVIERIKPGCSCTLVDVAVLGPGGERTPYEVGTPLAPGTKFELVAELDTSGKRNKQVKGVQLFANVRNGVRDLLLVSDIRSWLEAVPPRWITGRMSTKEARETVVRVTTTTDQPFLLHAGRGATHPTGARLDPDTIPEPVPGWPEAFSIELVPDGPDADGRSRDWQAKLRFGPGAALGNHVFTVPLVTDVPHPEGRVLNDEAPHHRLELTVSAEVVGVVTVSPAYISFGMVSEGQVISRTLRVACSDPEAEPLPEPQVELLTLTGEAPSYLDRVQVMQRRIEGLNAWEVEFVLDGLPEDLSDAGNTFKGRIRIETGYPGEEPLSLGYSGFIRRGARNP